MYQQQGLLEYPKNVITTMKKMYLWMLAAILTCGLTLTSCVKEDNAAVPVVPGGELVQPENDFETMVPALPGNPEVIAALQKIPGVKDVKCFHNVHMGECYFFNFEQDIDHMNPALGKFKQQVVLKYKGKDAHTVLHTEGYALRGDPEEDKNRLDSILPPDIVTTYKTNCVAVEHRYHGWSLPQGYSNEFTFLNTWQQSSDLHCIVTALKASGMFSGKWVSTGVSKNGETTAFYAYHYPNEMDAYVPYCGPYLTSLNDKRVGTQVLTAPDLKDELEKTKAAIRYAFSNKTLLNQLTAWYATEKAKTVKGMTQAQIEAMFAGEILGNLFDKEAYVHVNLWRSWIPTETSSAEEFYKFFMADKSTKYKNETKQEIAARQALAKHELNVQTGFDFLGRRAAAPAKRLDPYVAQTCVDLGNFSWDYAWFEDLLTPQQLKELNAYELNPKTFGVTYDNGKFINEFLEAMKTTPCKMLFVYGGSDPWTGGAIADDIVNANPNISKMIVQYGIHNDTTSYWTEANKKQLSDFLDPFLK